MQLDATDLKILSLLQADGRISNQDLAEKVFCRPLLVSAEFACWKRMGDQPLPRCLNGRP